MAEEAVFRITSEEDAWKALEDAIANKAEIPPDLKIVWSGWPVIRIYLPNVPEDATISTSMMSAILELQTSIYRTHALLTTGDSSLRRQTRFEKERFELRVKVEKGSSDLSINLPDIIAKYGHDIVAKMTGTELLIMVLGLALIYAGKLAYTEYLDAKTTQRKIASDDEKTKTLLDNFQAQLQHDSKRFEMLTQVVESRPTLKQIEYSANTARDEIVKAVAEENGGVIQGINIPREVANEISSVSRTRSSEANLSGTYRVAKVDTTAPDGFRVTLEDIKSGELVTASLFDALISAKHRQILQDAEWNKKPVHVEMSGRRLHGRMTDAKVVDVSAIEETSARSA
jgi:hypothetical protein